MKIILLSILISLNIFAVELNTTLKEISIKGEDGGLVLDASQWNSSSIKDKIYVLFYVDPDEKDTNAEFSDALKKKEFDKSNFGSIAVINLAATWKPNFIIESILKSKQEKFPRTIYVKDKNSVLVKKWGLADNSSEILIFSKNSKVLFYKSGKMTKEDISKAMDIITNNLVKK